MGRIAQPHLCGTCGETNKEKFYGHKKHICGKCHNIYTLELGRQKRDYIIEKLGGKCVYCNYNKYKAALHAHHIDPSEKDLNFKSIRGWSYERIDEELKRCELVCANCHSGIHSNEFDN